MLAKCNCVSKCQIWSSDQFKLGTVPKNPEEFGWIQVCYLQNSHLWGSEQEIKLPGLSLFLQLGKVEFEINVSGALGEQWDRFSVITVAPKCQMG